MNNYFVLLSLLVSFLTVGMHGTDDGVHPYDPNRDKEAIRKIAHANMSDLVTWYAVKWDRPNEVNKVCDSQVMQNLSPDFTKVFLKEGQPKGFVTYSTRLPFYREFVNSRVGANAVIHHLAVDQNERNKGYAKALVKAVVDECKSQEINRISLWTNGDDLDRFYTKLGFDGKGNTKMREFNYAMRLRPHPVVECMRYLKRFLLK